MKTSPKILLTNDDGINADGLKTLESAVKGLGEIYIVAPKENQSASSHSFTLRKPIKINQVKKNWYSVAGTPTDCVLAAHHGLFNKTLNLVISGINDSPNMGDDVLYSGTVAAAIEGTILGIPSIAISYRQYPKNKTVAKQLINVLAKELLTNGLPKKTLLNINIPAGKIKGIKITRMGKRIYKDMAILNNHPNGEVSYILDGDLSWEIEKGTDFEAVENNYISITPLHLDMTNYLELTSFRKKFSKLIKF
ncbi:MAG: 5'/3'-nucleotidase SurE [Candidatus Latescibacteria bacterium]|nr:5'/3'-nucleotidase SurE [Candidatus Latescibacterota bacterium]